jgi:large subunit ribosomal protein L21
MYAVIRAGGKQYRVAPGDVIRVERQANGSNGHIEFSEVLAVSGGEGQIGKPQSEARVVGEVVEQGRAKKILVFHYKRKKQYKKLRGHRQDFTAVRITEIAFDGQTFTAPALPKKEAKPKKVAAAAAISPELELPEDSAAIDDPTSLGKRKPTKKSAAKKSVAKKATPKKKK